jgi:hypothetical protein
MNVTDISIIYDAPVSTVLVRQALLSAWLKQGRGPIAIAVFLPLIAIFCTKMCLTVKILA